MDRKKQILLGLGLVIIWVAVGLWQWTSVKDPVRVPLTNVSGIAASEGSSREKTSPLRVNLGLLAAAQTQHETLFTTPRNIFAVPRSDGTLQMGHEDTPGELRAASEAGEAGQPLEIPAGPYRYLGFLRLGEHKKTKDIAVLSRNDEVLTVKVGDHVEEHLVLKAITPETATIWNSAARIEQTLPLTEEVQDQP